MRKTLLLLRMKLFLIVKDEKDFIELEALVLECFKRLDGK